MRGRVLGDHAVPWRAGLIGAAIAVAACSTAAAQQPAPPPLGAGLVAPAAGAIAAGVTIGGVPLGDLSRAAARAEVLRLLVAPKREPVAVRAFGRTFRISPARAGYVAEVDRALDQAMRVGRVQPLAQVDLPLRERVEHARISRILRWYERRFARQPRDASLSFRGARPIVGKAVIGIRLRMRPAVTAVAGAILRRDRAIYSLPVRRVPPERTSIGFVVVIDRGAFKLRLYRGERLTRRMAVAVGLPEYPTPPGLFDIVDMERNPTWYPPDSRWADGLGPVEPGAGNPLGTRWMGISAPAIGIHGTPQPETLGTRASHGCIRLSIRDAEWLYNWVRIGTPVKIV